MHSKDFVLFFCRIFNFWCLVSERGSRYNTPEELAFFNWLQTLYISLVVQLIFLSHHFLPVLLWHVFMSGHLFSPLFLHYVFIFFCICLHPIFVVFHMCASFVPMFILRFQAKYKQPGFLNITTIHMIFCIVTVFSSLVSPTSSSLSGSPSSTPSVYLEF